VPNLSSFTASLRSLLHPAGGADTDQRLLAGQARLLIGHSPVGIGAALLVALVQTDKLVLYFQDIVPLGSSREYEPHGDVLVRMLSEQGELVSPALFLPVAERYDLMPSIDLWVIRNTFAWWSARCADRGVQSPGLISINLSGKSLGSESFQDRVLSLINEYQIVSGTICFEFTETAAISSFELAQG